LGEQSEHINERQSVAGEIARHPGDAAASARPFAGMVGASRVRVHPALSYFKRRNYLSVDDDRHIVVHDVAALDRRCN